MKKHTILTATYNSLLIVNPAMAETYAAFIREYIWSLGLDCEISPETGVLVERMTALESAKARIIGKQAINA